MIIDPDYARCFTQARCVALQYGYSATASLHGSYTRDLDVLLTPWEARAIPNHDQLVRLIAQACGLRESVKNKEGDLNWTEQPHGRRAISLHFPGVGDPRWMDISISPCAPPAREERCTPFSHVVLENNNLPWLTVKELRAMLDKCKDHSMVCISGAGPVAKFYSEPGANEPHVLLTTR